MKPTVALVGIVTALLSTLPAGFATRAAAQGQSALEVVERLNEEAMEAYLNMDIERAGSMLEEALRVAQEGGVGGNAYAQTNLNLGIIYVGGLGDPQGGASYFLVAVCTMPGIQLDPLNSTPEMQETFSKARSQAQSGGCPTGVGGAGVSTSPVAPENVAPVGGGGSITSMDDETPWGEGGAAEDAGEFRRFFVQLSFTLGVAYIYPGMKPDRDPPDQVVFNTYDSAGNAVAIPDPAAVFQQNLQIMRAMNDPNNMDELPTPTQLQLREDTPWLPDGDSVDDIGALAGACSGDDIETGRGFDQTRIDDYNYIRSQALPSSYCVNVASAGFATTLALRMGLGYFITEGFGLGLVGRLQLGGGTGTLASFLFGPRMEFMLTDVEATGPSVSLFLGGTMGQIQIESPTGPASYQDPNTGAVVQVDAPWIVSGLFGAHLGVSTRFRLHPNFGLVFAPEIDVQFPDFLINVDLPLGVEAAF